jgi:hypothetical protein
LQAPKKRDGGGSDGGDAMGGDRKEISREGAKIRRQGRQGDWEAGKLGSWEKKFTSRTLFLTG